jgi:hypothetical protein
MAFWSQQSAVQSTEEMGGIWQDAGLDTIGNWENVGSSSQLNKDLPSTEPTNLFGIPYERPASSISPCSISPIEHIIQIEPPFNATQSQASEFDKYGSDDPVSGTKRLGNEALGRTFDPLSGPFSVNQLGVSWTE